MGRVGASVFLLVGAVVVFMLATLGVEVAELDTLRMMALGLVLFALAHLVP